MRWLVTIFSTGVFLTNIATGTTRTTPPTLVPRLQILTTAKAEHNEPGFDTPRRIDTFPKGTVQPARKVESKGITYWVSPFIALALTRRHPEPQSFVSDLMSQKPLSGLAYWDTTIWSSMERQRPCRAP